MSVDKALQRQKPRKPSLNALNEASAALERLHIILSISTKRKVTKNPTTTLS